MQKWISEKGGSNTFGNKLQTLKILFYFQNVIHYKKPNMMGKWTLRILQKARK
jgi:hypothetical protein